MEGEEGRDSDVEADPTAGLFESFRYAAPQGSFAGTSTVTRPRLLKRPGLLGKGNPPGTSSSGASPSTSSNIRNSTRIEYESLNQSTETEGSQPRRRQAPTIEYEVDPESTMPSSSQEDSTTQQHHANSKRDATEFGLSHWFKQQPKNQRTTTSVHPPDGWEHTLMQIRYQRQEVHASVDEFHAFLVQLREHPEPHFECLVAGLMSVQVRDGVALAAMKKLQAYEGNEGYLTVEKIARMSLEALEGTISTLNYYRTKAKNIKAIADILQRRYDGQVPDSLTELVTLPGVGPKVAHLVLSVAFKNDAGIVVDTHVHRLCRRLGWATQGKSLTAEHTRRSLEKWLPHDLWAEFTLLCIGFSQTICTPIHPKCGGCPLQATCPSAFKCTSSSQEIDL